MKKLFALLLALTLLSLSFGALADEYLVFTTGGTTGTYYAFGGEIAALLTIRRLEGQHPRHHAGRGRAWLDPERRHELRLPGHRGLRRPER